MSDTRIEEGDEVTVRFEHLEPVRGKVVYTPQATGDCWTIQMSDGCLVNVQNFAFMIRTPQSPSRTKGEV